MAPRKRRSRLDIKSSEDLLPTLPKPQDLRPFPTQSAVVYKGHTGVVRSLSLDPSGQFLASVSDDLQLRVWEVTTGRCLRTVSLPNQPAMEEEGAVMDKTMRFVGFSPKHATQSVIALSMGKSLLLFNSSVGDRLINEKTDTYFTSLKDTLLNAPSVGGLVWSWAEDDLQFSGCRAVLSHPKPIRDVCWHSNGDYLASVCGLDSTGSQTVFVHQLSKCKSQVPFTKCKGVVQRVLFHSSRPLFFVATQRYVRIYDLAQLTLVKKLQAGTRYVSSMSLHPSGDHLLLSGFDGKVLWFDLDLSTRPYRTLQQHKRAVRSVAYHPHFPLFASCSDDGATAICHGRVFSDLTRNAFIVPVKLLRGHAVSKNGLCVTDCVFHPLQPWIFTAGADGRIRLYV